MLTNSVPDKSQLSARERILVTAHDLFYREGIRATGIDRVIAESGVTKVTFYRHFPSKNLLTLAYLEYRHVLWMNWFRAALLRHGCEHRGVAALPDALDEWLSDEHYRGCAFINAAVEFGSSMPDVMEICRGHKEDLVRVIAELLPPERSNPQLAEALAAAVDGACVHTQMGMSPALVRAGLETSIASLVGGVSRETATESSARTARRNSARKANGAVKATRRE
jgi:AcrR family transcriptional regulator